MTRHDTEGFSRPRKLTKKARKEAVRAIIDGNDIGVLFDGEDRQAFNNLTGADFSYIKREINQTFPTAVRHVVVSECGTIWQGFSWNKAIDGWVATSPTLIAKAARYAIMPQIREYREAAAQECVECGRLYDLTVDHLNPSFSAILKQFTHVNGDIELADGPEGMGRVIARRDVNDAWVSFHKKHASYQILCRSCNSRKGASACEAE